MSFKLDQIVEADAERQHKIEVPFEVNNGDGRPHTEKILITYRPLTPEILRINGLAEQLAATIVSWDIEEPCTPDVLVKRPLPFLTKIQEAITADFFPAKSS